MGGKYFGRLLRPNLNSLKSWETLNFANLFRQTENVQNIFYSCSNTYGGHPPAQPAYV